MFEVFKFSTVIWLAVSNENGSLPSVIRPRLAATVSAACISWAEGWSGTTIMALTGYTESR